MMFLLPMTVALAWIKRVGICAFLTASALASQLVSAQEVATTSNVAIVSPSRPTDSRGDAVYESQSEKQNDLPVVAGVLVQPKILKTAKPKFPKSLRKRRQSADVTVEGVITPDGKLIDPKIIGPAEDDTSKSALDAVSKYQFQPATLDSKPVAVLIHVVLNFRID